MFLEELIKELTDSAALSVAALAAVAAWVWKIARSDGTSSSR